MLNSSLQVIVVKASNQIVETNILFTKFLLLYFPVVIDNAPRHVLQQCVKTSVNVDVKRSPNQVR
jgi:hypothetical protein